MAVDDAAFFTGNVSSPALDLTSGVHEHLNITADGGTIGKSASVTMSGSGVTLRNCAVVSQETVRLANDTANYLIENCWLDANGLDSDDHADCIQGYPPSSGGGTTTVRNTTFRLGGFANACYFMADGWKGNHVLQDCLFWARNAPGSVSKGIMVASDGGGTLSLRRVYFTRNFDGDGLWMVDRPIVLWEDVYYCDVVGGEIVNLTPIAQP